MPDDCAAQPKHDQRFLISMKVNKILLQLLKMHFTHRHAWPCKLRIPSCGYLPP